MSARRRILTAALAAAALGVAAPVGAQAPAPAEDPAIAAARAAYLQGQDYGNAGLWVEAEERFRVSAQLRRSPTTLAMLARAQHELGFLVEARESYLAFMAEPASARSAKLEPAALAALAELDRKVAKVVIVLEPGPVVDPAVQLDGVPVAAEKLQQNLLVNPGTHEISARAAGRAPARARLVIPEGGSATVTLTLAAVAPPLASAAAPPRDGPRRALPIVLMGAGVAVLGAGIAVGLMGFAEARHAPDGLGPEASAARTKGVAGDVLGGLGIAAAGAGLVLLVVDRLHAAPPGVAGLGHDGPWLRF